MHCIGNLIISGFLMRYKGKRYANVMSAFFFNNNRLNCTRLMMCVVVGGVLCAHSSLRSNGVREKKNV